MNVFRVEILPRDGGAGVGDRTVLADLRDAGLDGAERVVTSRLFFLEGDLTADAAERIGRELLADPLTERCQVLARDEPVPSPRSGCSVEVHLRPGVMDPVADSTLAELRAEGEAVEAVRTARRYVVSGSVEPQVLHAAAARALANDCIELTAADTAGVRPSPVPPMFEYQLRQVAIRELDDAQLQALSREGHLFLALDEMRAIQAHFRGLQRDPTDLELETLAQTWSEHCVHKTLKSAVVYRGAPMRSLVSIDGDDVDDANDDADDVEIRYDNLLADTIVRATEQLIAQGRGPECLSVFKDNAGIIGFDGEFGIAFKVETHNHPSAIEPYGGAATGIGGCIRDVIGCGLGARPIANTTVFCVAPSDWPADRLPTGVLHPWRVLRGVVKGVADYGNRMGIPTVNGAIHFDPRYLGNPLVYCGCAGVIPRDRIEKEPRPGDLIVLVGGRTGRDGIHGATFSSAELTDSHADEFSHAVQIGNAITEKRFLDAIMRARDDESGCLYTAITDCGAGGLSSAVGEMGEHIGAVVDLDSVPLKYAGLRYDEIWISEAQERMVLAVPFESLQRFNEIMREEEVEATVIGAFGTRDDGMVFGRDADLRPGPIKPQLVVRYKGLVVGHLDMRFVHHGLPKRERIAEWRPTGTGGQAASGTRPPVAPARGDDSNRGIFETLLEHLKRPNIQSKEWVIRQYDHEVQGGSVVKPLCGRGAGPSDAAVVRPRLDSFRGIALGCGAAPALTEVDPYLMALASIDEAIRNVVCVGGDPAQTAILDNFCWGRADDPRRLGELVRACQACHDGAMLYGVPFISGKDSLNNEFALNEADVDALLETLHILARRDGPDAVELSRSLPELEARIRETKRLCIPGTLLISAIAIVHDVRNCITADLKKPGAALYVLSARDEQSRPALHRAVADAISARLVAACHDAGDGGWLAALAEMAIAGRLGADVSDGLAGSCGAAVERAGVYVIEAADAAALERFMQNANVPCVLVGRVEQDPTLRGGHEEISVEKLSLAWRG